MSKKQKAKAPKQISLLPREERWEKDYSINQKRHVMRVGDIFPHDKLKFAKRILMFLFILILIILALMFCFPNNPHTEKVWAYSFAAISGTVGILIGYYFTSKVE